MPKISKKTQKTIDQIVALASEDLANYMKQLYNTSKQLVVEIDKEIKLDKKWKPAQKSANTLWWECTNLYNKIWKSGVPGHEVKRTIADIKQKVNTIQDQTAGQTTSVIQEALYDLSNILLSIDGFVAITGTIGPMSKQTAGAPGVSERSTVPPTSIKYEAQRLREIALSPNSAPQTKQMAMSKLREMAKIIQYGRVPGSEMSNEYQQLLNGGAKEMLREVEQEAESIVL
jgi:hypothetical protein